MALILKEIDYKKLLVCILIGAAGFLNSSCLDIHYYKGKTILVSTTDTILNGASIITGRVYHIEYLEFTPFKLFPGDIWMENARYRTTTDSLGNYTLKVSPGIYTLKCQEKGNMWDLLIEEKRDVVVAPNKKVRLDFYLGYRVE